MKRHAGIARPASVDVRRTMAVFMGDKLAGDQQIAERLIEVCPVYSEQETNTVQQIVHVTLDAILEQALLLADIPVRDMVIEVVLEVNGGRYIITDNSPSERSLSGDAKESLRKKIIRAMEPHVEELFRGQSFPKKDVYIKILLKHVSLHLCNSLVDTRIDPNNNAMNFLCEVRRPR